MDNRVRIIRLGDVNTPNEAFSFEDAFGEFSEARGKLKKRFSASERKRRKLERIANRREVRAARQEAKAERQQTRIANRTAAQAARQQKHTAAEEARAERKGLRKQHRIERKALGQEEDTAPQDQGLDTGVAPDMGGAPDVNVLPRPLPPDFAPTSEPQDTGAGYDETGSYDSGVENGGYDANYTSAETSYDYGNEEPNPDAVGTEGEYTDEGDYAGGGDYLGEYNDAEAPFDGIMGAEDRFAEFTDGNIDPKVQDVVNKLVWNKELVSRLEKQRNSVGGDRKQALSKQIILRKKRANELQSQLDGYCNCEGDYSGADGKVVAGNRRAEVALAHRRAMRNRKRLHKPQVTPVQRGLNPRISPNKIVIPAKSAFTGLNGLDLQDDFDAPPVREVMLGADGSSTSKISWTSVAIGLAVGAATIWALKKYKVIK